MLEIELEDIEAAIIYLTKRQLQGRPITMRQLGKRFSLAASRMLDALEEVGVVYVLAPHRELVTTDAFRQASTEVIMKYLPERYAKALGIAVDAIERSFEEIVGPSPKPAKEYVEAQEMGAYIAEKTDPFAGFRINRDKYEVLKNHLITFDELVQVAREQGYSVAAIRRATGGDRMRYPLPSNLWRPYVLGNRRFYLKDVLDRLGESDGTYKSRAKLDRKRKERIGEPANGKYIQFDRYKKTKKVAKGKKGKEKT